MKHLLNILLLIITINIVVGQDTAAINKVIRAKTITTPKMEDCLGLIDELVYIKYYSELIVLARMSEPSDKLYIPTNSLTTQITETTQTNKGKQNGQDNDFTQTTKTTQTSNVDGTITNPTYTIRPTAFNDQTFRAYLEIKIQSDRLIAELISDLSRNKLKYYRNLDIYLAEQTESGSIKKYKYGNYLKRLDKLLTSVPTLAGTYKTYIVNNIDKVKGADASTSSPISDYTGVFTALYSVYKDFYTAKQSELGRLIFLLNAVRISTPNDLINNVQNPLISTTPGGQIGGGGNNAGGGGNSAGGGGNSAGGGGN